MNNNYFFNTDFIDNLDDEDELHPSLEQDDEQTGV
jgi:hypothetical protein